MSKTILFIATSLDGFIAKPDGNLDWLTTFPLPQTGDYGYEALLDRIGMIVMGRKTYEALLGFDISWPYTAYQTVVVTTQQGFNITSPNTSLLTGNIADFMAGQKWMTKDIWLVGGGELITSFLNEGLIDEMIITILPKILGEGVPLFAPKPNAGDWQLIETQSFETGAVNLTYQKRQ